MKLAVRSWLDLVSEHSLAPILPGAGNNTYITISRQGSGIALVVVKLWVKK